MGKMTLNENRCVNRHLGGSRERKIRSEFCCMSATDFSVLRAPRISEIISKYLCQCSVHVCLPLFALSALFACVNTIIAA
jgi:hypothetical protein